MVLAVLPSFRLFSQAGFPESGRAQCERDSVLQEIFPMPMGIDRAQAICLGLSGLGLTVNKDAAIQAGYGGLTFANVQATFLAYMSNDSVGNKLCH